MILHLDREAADVLLADLKYHLSFPYPHFYVPVPKQKDFAMNEKTVEPTVKLPGYRNLTAAEVQMITRIKEEGKRLQELVETIQESTPGYDHRWLQIGKTDLQTGLMALTRAVAQPDSFA